MQKRVFIIHGWSGYPEEGWFPWLKSELEKRGFLVFVPQLPETDEPRINNWIPEIAKIVGELDHNTYFVGHSMGCQAIARYLAGIEGENKAGGAVFVAGFFKRLTNLEGDPLSHRVAKEWLESPLDFNEVKKHLTGSIAIFSDNDPYVPLDNQMEFKDYLNSKIIIDHGKGHFSGSKGCQSLEPALEAMMELSASSSI